MSAALARLAATVVLTATLCLLPCGAARADPIPTWVWPTSGAEAPAPQIARRFESPVQQWSPGHRGADLVAADGSGVHAAGAGVVSFAGSVAGRGVVVVGHPDGTRTTYEPVLATVRVGTAVPAGQLLGALSPAGGHCLPRVCLHWGRLRGEIYLNPLALLGRLGPPRLLPVWAPGSAGGAGPLRPTRLAALTAQFPVSTGEAQAPPSGATSSTLRSSPVRESRATPAEPPGQARWALAASTSGASLMLPVVLMLIAGVRSVRAIRAGPAGPERAGRSQPDSCRHGPRPG